MQVAEETDTKASDEAKDPEKKDSEEKDGKKDEKRDEFEFDIGKVLEETAVPSLPSVRDLERENKKRKSVTFAEGGPKECVQKNFALVQGETNLEEPPEVVDEFDEFVTDYPLPTSPPKVYASKKILKKSPSDKKEDQEGNNAEATDKAGKRWLLKKI